MKNYCILTLSKFPDHLDRCLTSIFLKQPDLSFQEVFVVDDGLPDVIKKRWPVNYITGIKPFIFARNFNLGIKTVPKDKDVFFLGDDGALLTAQGIDLLAERVKNMSEIGIVSPVIAGSVKNFYQIQGVINGFVTGNQLKTMPAYCPTIIFVAVYIKRAVIDLVGPIPEELHGYGFEDDYFSKKMRNLHYDWAVDSAVVVRHGFGKFTSASSYQREGLDPVKLMEINRKIYEDLMKDEP